MSAVFATASPRRIKATHRRRRKVTAGPSVQRYYDPAIGGFLSGDPAAVDLNSAANFCRYCYSNDNPLRFKDIDGRSAIDTVKKFFTELAKDLGGGDPKATTASNSNASSRAPEYLAGTTDSGPKRAADAVVAGANAIPKSPHQVAAAGDSTAKWAGRTEAVATVTGMEHVAIGAGAVSITASFVAVAAEPTTERGVALLLNLATAGTAGGLKALGEQIPAKSVTVGVQVSDEITRKDE